MGMSFLLVLCTNATTIWLSLGGLALAAAYPFMKRYTYLPASGAGARRSPGACPWPSPPRPAACPLLRGCCTSPTCCGRWATTRYYAMTDRDDDLKIGVKSTAILFGDADRVIILTLQSLALGVPVAGGDAVRVGWLVPSGAGSCGGVLRLGVLVHPRPGPPENASRRFAQPLGRVGNFSLGSWLDYGFR